MKKNDRVTAICEDYTYDGMGIVKVNGFPLFVKGLLVKEQAEIIVTSMKQHYGYGRVIRLIQENKERVTPRCPLAGKCGGCQLQHMSKAHQAWFKKHQCENAMRRIGGIETKVNDVLCMEDAWYYRNKAQIPFDISKAGVISGFYRIHSNTIIDMEECAIQHPLINRISQRVKQEFKQNRFAAQLRHLLIKYSMSDDEAMVVFIMAQRCKAMEAHMVRVLPTQIPQIKSILCNINERSDNVILGDTEILLYGKPYINDSIHGLQFQISMKSFYQVNPLQTRVLYETALRFAQLSGKEEVVDLYCGVGTISMFLAKAAKHVTGIEIIPSAIVNAKENARRNHVDNVDFICCDAAAYAKLAKAQNKKADVVIVDPPRKGCAESVLFDMVKLDPKIIVYVSCNVSTQARDLRILAQCGYRITQLQPVDMFPQTYGIECVAQLCKS